jgi:5-methylthioadenosine/S-adenosylhomocysteine deaminase
VPVRGGAQDAEADVACLAYSMAELLRTGTTTIMEIGHRPLETVEEANKVGLRLYMGPGYRSGKWLTRDGKRAEWEWDEAAGDKGMAAAVDFIERYDGTSNGRVKGFLSPMQIDTCTEDLLRKSVAAAKDLNVPMALHVAQSVTEFNEMTARHGMSPVEWLESIGFLAPNVILGHAIILAGGSWANYGGDDISILARTGANIAHCVWVFARRGIVMESFARYQAAGINMTLGTDTAPQSMIEALRWAAVCSKIVDRKTDIATAADVFNAATLNGAKALNRTDIGRIEVGAKADLLIWEGDSIFMTPMRDPVKNIVYSAQAEDLNTVIIDGITRMQDRVIPGVDPRKLALDLQAAGERMWPAMQEHDWNNRGVDQLSPLSFPAWD